MKWAVETKEHFSDGRICMAPLNPPIGKSTPEEAELKRLERIFARSRAFERLYNNVPASNVLNSIEKSQRKLIVLLMQRTLHRIQTTLRLHQKHQEHQEQERTINGDTNVKIQIYKGLYLRMKTNFDEHKLIRIKNQIITFIKLYYLQMQMQ